MSVLYPLTPPWNHAVVPPCSALDSAVSAKLAHNVAPRRPLPRDKFRIKGELDSGTVDLYRGFLKAVADECPEVVTACLDLYPVACAAFRLRPGWTKDERGRHVFVQGPPGPEADAALAAYRSALLKWAGKYQLYAPWLVNAVNDSFGNAFDLGIDAFWPVGVNTELYYSPIIQGATIAVDVPQSHGGETLSAYKSRVVEIFKAKFDEHLATALDELEQNPAVEKVPMIQRVETQLQDAALWQVRGDRLEQEHTHDAESIRSLLKRLDFQPRPGLTR